MSLVWYLREFLRMEWIHNFLFVKTAPLETPPYFRDFPLITGKECDHELQCMMICPAPGAIEVLWKKDHWEPVVHKGHCIRCGLCVEACPAGVLTSGRILEAKFYQNLAFYSVFHLSVDDEKCMRCGNCSVACPINKEADPVLSATGTSSSEEVIMRVKDGRMTILHEEKCTGCKTCEETCPNNAIRVARVVEAVQEEEELP